MIENISIACDAVFGAGSENFGTVTGNATFQNGSANSGTVNGNATFEGNAVNKFGAVVTGNATFDATAVNSGTVQGTVTVVQTFESLYQAWLAANVGVNQYIGEYTGSGNHNGQWAYNQTTYASEGEANAACYADWLANNVGVNQYTGPGLSVGKWAYNQTEYPSQADAQAAFEATFIQFGNVVFTKTRDEEAFDNDGNSIGNYKEFSWGFDVEPIGTQPITYKMQINSGFGWFDTQTPNWNTSDPVPSLRVEATNAAGTFYLSVPFPTNL